MATTDHSLERGLPASIDAERSILGAILLDNFLYNSAAETLKADDFALDLTGDAPAFVGAMERLADLNLAERRPHRLKELLFYSHPSIDRRIMRARESAQA